MITPASITPKPEQLLVDQETLIELAKEKGISRREMRDLLIEADRNHPEVSIKFLP